MSTGLVQIGSNDENAITSISKNGKPKPLQASTNIIHAKTPRRIDNLIHEKARQLPGKQIDEPLKKKQIPTVKKTSDLKLKQKSKSSENATESTIKSSNKNTTRAKSTEKTDENDVVAMVKNSYDPLKDVYHLDEELFKKVMSLELEDDGIPEYDYSEPFDF